MFAFIFESAGFGEWFVLLAVVLIVVGPKKLPETARKLGQYYNRFRRAAEGFKRQLMDMDTEFERAADSAAKATSEAFDLGAAEREAQAAVETSPYPGHEPENEFSPAPEDTGVPSTAPSDTASKPAQEA